MSDRDYTSIPVKEKTRVEVIKLKRGGESYDDLVKKMMEEFDREPVEVEL